MNGLHPHSTTEESGSGSDENQEPDRPGDDQNQNNEYPLPATEFGCFFGSRLIHFIHRFGSHERVHHLGLKAFKRNPVP